METPFSQNRSCRTTASRSTRVAAACRRGGEALRTHSPVASPPEVQSTRRWRILLQGQAPTGFTATSSDGGILTTSAHAELVELVGVHRVGSSRHDVRQSIDDPVIGEALDPSRDANKPGPISKSRQGRRILSLAVVRFVHARSAAAVTPQLVGQRRVVHNSELTVGSREAGVERTDPGEVAWKRSRLHDNDTVELDAPRSFGVLRASI